MLEIDGSAGEGGGQILRSSLALALLTGQACRISQIRANRRKPGLQRQHLAAAKAAAALSAAEVRGLALGSRELTFAPGAVTSGDYHFDVGSAGSATLVLQTVLLPLLLARGPSTLVLEGGTHNPQAPPFDFLARSFLPVLARMGASVTATLERPGFAPVGGGRVRVAIAPTPALPPLDLCHRGAVRRQVARALVAGLPAHIGERELAVVKQELGWSQDQLRLELVPEARGPGNALILELESAEVTEVCTAFGRQGLPAEQVAAQAVQEAREYLTAEVPVGRHLQDQLLLPLALAGGGVFVTSPLTLHTQTNLAVIRQFLPVDFSCREVRPGAWEVAVARRA